MKNQGKADPKTFSIKGKDIRVAGIIVKNNQSFVKIETMITSIKTTKNILILRFSYPLDNTSPFLYPFPISPNKIANKIIWNSIDNSSKFSKTLVVVNP